MRLKQVEKLAELKQSHSFVMCNHHVPHKHMFMLTNHKLPHETVAFSAVLLVTQIQMVHNVC